MDSSEEIIVIGPCIQVGENFLDIRFRGFYKGVELSLVRAYCLDSGYCPKLNSEVMLRLLVICVSGSVLETRLVNIYSIE